MWNYIASTKSVWKKAVVFIGLFLLTSCHGSLSAGKTEFTQIPSPALPIESETYVTESTEMMDETALPELDPISIWIPDSIPTELREGIRVPEGILTAKGPEKASLNLLVHIAAETPAYEYQTPWVYVLVTPFPSLVDNISVIDLQRAWRGEETEIVGENRLMMSEETQNVFEVVWGPPIENGVEIVPKDDLLNHAWEAQSAWTILPFEELQPRWKVVSVDGMSPLDKDLDVSNYPLAIVFGVNGDEHSLAALRSFDKAKQLVLPMSNRDTSKLTVVVMTGTTALARGTALRMEEVGIPYPAVDIQDWLWFADLAHISSEVPFYELCPPAIPLRREARFCSDPSYIELLEFSGIDIVELTGNHIMDWGPEAFAYTLELYEEHGFLIFGGGWTQEEARQPLLVEHNGNRLAFIGCNAMGPENSWATDELPGSASCDMEWIQEQIIELGKNGYMPIITFQHFEVCEYQPQSTQRGDFEAMAASGAVIVSGSQAHCPQTMTFVGDHFVHFGLGNLFFDQMDSTYERSEFIDRHVFYDGRYISTELLTAFLEDSARPRPMLPEERLEFLAKIYEESGW
jgi:hypothetical protein